MAGETFPRLPPAEAIDYFRRKGFKVGFAWQDVWQEEHARAFTVAKAMSRDVLETIRAAVDDAIVSGKTLEQFRAELTPLLQAKGWWGRKQMIDPGTGQMVNAQLGSPRRLKIIYEMNLRMAQAAGRWDQIQRTKQFLPYLRYTAVMDDRTRPQHAEWHGTILPVDDPWWDTHYPPCGWNCRCTVIQLDADTIGRRGWQVSAGPPPAGKPTIYVNPRTGEQSAVPDGIDPGFVYNVGKAWLGGIEPAPIASADLPALEVGVDDLAPVPADAPEPTSLLPGGIGEQPAIDAFLDGAGAPPAGGVVDDSSGWPLPIGANWFKTAGGEPAVPAGDRRRTLGLVGKAIAKPEQIRLRWVTGADGTKMLFRRYIATVDGLPIVVDVGKPGWRFATARDAGFDLAKLTAGTLVYDGRADATGEIGAAVRKMWDGGKHAEVDLGTVSADNRDQVLKATGVDIGGYERVIATSGVRHVRKSHGNTMLEGPRSQLAVRPADFDLIPAIIAQGDVQLDGTPGSRKPMRLIYRATIGGKIYDYREEIGPGRKRLLMQGLRIEGLAKKN